MTSTPPPTPTTANTAAPVAITTVQHVDIWNHLLQNILKHTTGDDMFKVLQKNGVMDVEELMTEYAYNKEIVEKWRYKRDDGTTYTISRKNIADIAALQDFILDSSRKHGYSTPGEMTHAELMALTRHDFTIMRTDPQYRKDKDRNDAILALTSPGTPGTNSAGTGGGGASNAGPGTNSAGTGGGGASNAGTGTGGGSFNFTASQLFKKSIKRDPAQFPQLKSDSGFDSWRRGTEIQAKVQDVEEILNKNYAPSTTEEKELFELKQNYMYAVFEKNLLTNKGKRIVGHVMTVKILTLDTKKILHRANVRSAEFQDTFNWKALTTLDGEDAPEIIKSIRDRLLIDKDKDKDDEDNKEIKAPASPIIPLQDLIGRTFLMDARDDGEKHRARIVEAINDHQDDTEQRPEHVKFRCSVNDDQYEEIVTYNDIISHIEAVENQDQVWKFRRIVSHEGPLTSRHPNWRGSGYNVMIEWENGEVTREPLTMIAADDPVTCAIYARDNDLLEKPGWKRFKKIARRQKKLFRMANQAKLRSFRTAPKYMYGFEIPKDYQHAMKLDARNGNDKWGKCTALEFEQLDEYDTFIDIFHSKTPPGYKKIKVHLVYAVKHDGRHKARCVADGHLTDVPIDSVYSGVVSLRGLRMLLFLAELNDLETWATDIGNAYLEAVTDELLVIIAGPEFGEREGHMLIIFKALYGLRSSGLRWHQRFSDVMRSEGFRPCKMEPDIWLREKGGVYEYVAVYVDDLAFAMHNPEEFTNMLMNKYSFKLKGTGSIEYHLGCDFTRDEDGTLCMRPKKYIERMVDGYKRMFGEKPNRRVKSPLEENDHPELDDSDFLDEEGTSKYQSLVGSMQWAISLGRFDIATACMTLSSFRACPRIGHLDRAKRVVSYLSNMSDATIRFRTIQPDYTDLPGFEYDWDATIYGDVREEIPSDAPTPLGKTVTLTHFVDANLYHDMLTGRSVTGILHLMNQTPMDWHAKKQGKVETATYGSEFMAARTTVEQIEDLRITLRYLGVPIHHKSYLFGDNEAVVNSASRIDSRLHKRHNALSFSSRS